MFPHISGASSADEEPAPEVSEESSVEEEDEVVDDAAVTDHAPKRKVKRRRKRQFKVAINPRQHQSFAGEPKRPVLDRLLKKISGISPSASSPSLVLPSAQPAPTTPRFDIDVLKAVLHREGMCRVAKDKSQMLIALARAGKPLDDAVKNLLEHLLSLRDASADVVEGIVAWRRHQMHKTGSSGMGVFLWEGLDYLHKLCNDLDFMGTCEPLLASLKLSPAILRANPFMLPQNLADRAVALAQSSSHAVDTLTLVEAERLLLSSSLLPSFRSLLATLPPGGSTTGLSWQKDYPADSSTRLARRSEDRLKAAEIVTLHHLAAKAGDSGLTSKLDRPSVVDSFGEPSTIDAPSSRAPLGLSSTDPLRSTRPQPSSLDGDDVVLGDGDGVEPAVGFDPAALTQSMHASDALNSSDKPTQHSFRPKGLAHSLKKASNIYADTKDVELAMQRRSAARAAAATASVSSTHSSSVVLPPPQPKVKAEPQAQAKKAHSSRTSAASPTTDALPTSIEKKNPVKKPAKRKQKSKPADSSVAFDPTGLTDKSLRARTDTDDEDVPPPLSDSMQSQSRVHRRTRSVDGMRLLISGSLKGNGNASVTVLDARSGLTGSVDLQVHQESELEAAMATLRVRAREDAAALDVSV